MHCVYKLTARRHQPYGKNRGGFASLSWQLTSSKLVITHMNSFIRCVLGMALIVAWLWLISAVLSSAQSVQVTTVNISVDHLQQVFALTDTNSDGSVDTLELGHMIAESYHRLDIPMSVGDWAELMLALFNRIDVDQDGAIQFQEVIQLFQS